MKILALETNEKKMISSLLQPGERLIESTGFHPCVFWFHVIDDFFQTFVIGVLAWLTIYVGGAPVIVGSILAFSAFAWLVIPDFSQALIDWLFDEIIITDKRVIYVNQGNIFQRSIKEMDLENVASVTFKTQYLNLFPFGILHFDLKEGVGRSLEFKYIPNPQRVCGWVSNAVMCRQEELTNK